MKACCWGLRLRLISTFVCFLGARSWHSCGQALLFNTFEESGGSLGGVQYTPVTPSLHFHFWSPTTDLVKGGLQVSAKQGCDMRRIGFNLPETEGHVTSCGKENALWIGPISLSFSLSMYIYMSNRKNPGNTKYVFDGHWLMEIDGNC